MKFVKHGLRGLLLYALVGMSMSANSAQAPIVQGDQATLLQNNASFAFKLYQQIDAEDRFENFVYSPYSLSTALAMTYIGARGNTAIQMADTMVYTLEGDALHATMQSTVNEIALRAQDGNGGATLRLANRLFGDVNYPFNGGFISKIQSFYGADLQKTDFAADAEGARTAINDWVAEQTDQRILDLVPQGAIDALTRLVLTNAVYFAGVWKDEFPAEDTQDEAFTLADGSQVSVPMMRNKKIYAYSAGAGYQAAVLPYGGSGLGMLLILPDEGNFDALESAITGDTYVEMLNGLRFETVEVVLPRWQFETTLGMKDLLQSMGMVEAFDPLTANFDGMKGTPMADSLSISDVFHKAFISVDEKGAEAAAASAVVVEIRSAGVKPNEKEFISLRFDRPFLFAIVDTLTGAPIFVGRVMNPQG